MKTTLPKKKPNRVQFPTQRVNPATYAKARALRTTYGSLGRVLDAALAKL
jgi:hypothetical protein